MIAYVRGELITSRAEEIVVEAGGIGYDIRVPLSVSENLPPVGTEVRIYTYLQVREDTLQLFGFLTQDDLEVFRLLLRVNGVGPKGALSVLSVMSADDLRFAVLSGDAKAIAAAPGLGPKTAQKVILELKDKLELGEAWEGNRETGQVSSAFDSESPAADARGEAVRALTALGYTAAESGQAVRAVQGAESMDVETILKQALRQLSLF